ncbi:MAG: phosphatidate cytidylyltransferase [Gammaproteobacteria bacterium]
MNTLLQRIITAVLLIALLVLVLFALPPLASIAAISGLVLIGAWEWGGFLGFKQKKAHWFYVLFIAAAMLGAGWLMPDREWVLAVLQGSMVWWGIAFLWMLRYPTSINPLVTAICGAFVLLPAWLALVNLILVEPLGAELVLLVLVIVWAADIGAYFVGRKFGRVRLAPRVSPGKTWEGLLGGLVGAALGASLGGLYFGWPAAEFIPLGLSVGAISVVGDLTVSMFKRNAGLKDSGRLVPGHGGLLDRIDSVTAAVPLFVIELTWLQALTAG